ncbi:MAG: hypothetical protein OXQ84_21280 [bacterium]|nr:hypothetical protein [bacterium]
MPGRNGASLLGPVSTGANVARTWQEPSTASLATRLFELGWLERSGRPARLVPPRGEAEFSRLFGMTLATIGE